MFRGIILLLMLILNFVFIQNAVFAQDTYAQKVYLDELQQKIGSNWINPINKSSNSLFDFFTIKKDAPFSSIEFQRKEFHNDFDKSVLISFTINQDGSFSNIAIQRSSDNIDFDNSVVKSIYKTNPIGPLTDNQISLNVLYFFSPTFTNISTVGNNPLNTSNNIVNVANLTPDLSCYTQDLQNKLLSNWHPKSFKKKRNATILVSVYKDGTIKDIKIQKSSCKKNFDFEITDAIMKSVPLAPLPARIQSEYKDIQLSFSYEKSQDKNNPQKQVIAIMNPQDGYDEYVDQVGKIISQRLKEKKYFCKKDINLEMNLNKDGKLTYVKVKNESKKGNFIRNDFNRKTLITLQQTAFTPIPYTMGVDNITLDYRLLTQRKRFFRSLLTDYVWNFFRTGLETFCVQTTENI